MPYLDFEPVPSLVDPAGTDFVVRVPSTDIRGDKMPILGVTKFKDFPYNPRSRSRERWTKNHVFVHRELGAKSDEQPEAPFLWEFYFAQGRTVAESSKPVSYLTRPATNPHPWPNVIERLGFLQDATRPMSYEIGGQRVNVPRLFERYWKIPGGTYASKMQVRIYLSNKPFTEADLRLNTPVPGVVTWDMDNLSRSVEALHPLIRFRERQTSATVVPDCGTIEHPILQMQTQVFPATGHPRWIDHVCDVHVSEERGVHRLAETFVRVPGIKRIKNSA